MKLIGLWWIGVTMTLAFAGAARAQTAPSDAAKLAPNSQTQGSACNPSCAQNQVCASKGQCTPLVPVGGNAAQEQTKLHPATRRNSTAMMVTGIALMGVGGIITLIGLAAVAVAPLGCAGGDDSSSSGSCEDGVNRTRTVGFVMAGGGALLAIVGIPLILIGAKRVPNKDAVTESQPPVRSTPQAYLVLGPFGLSLIGAF